MRYFALIVAAVFSAACQPSAKPAESKSQENEEGPVIHVNAKEASALLEDKDATKRPTVIDVRSQDEYDEGHLKGAQVLDFLEGEEEFEESLKKLDRDKPYLIHCASGRRSNNSLAIWKKLGFTKVYHLDGGIKAWEDAKLPVER